MDEIIKYNSTDNVFDDVCRIIDDSQRAAYHSDNVVLVLRNWLLGKRISDEEMNGDNRAKYGAEIVKKLSASLSEKYGKGFSIRVLYKCQQFYKYFPDIVPTASAQMLSWSHYEKLLQVPDSQAREWYAKEAYEQTWSVRTLQRNVSSQYYYRLIKSQDASGVENEMKELTRPLQDKLEFVKNPVIAEFLGMQVDASYLESDLEQCIIDNLQKFIMELGKGYAFVARQQHIHTDKKYPR